MQMCNEIVVDAAPHLIYERVAATEHWPEILPHYRFVRVIAGDATRRTVEMAAWAKPFRMMTVPVRWRAEQINDPVTPSIFFRHLAGWTKGMRVQWRFEQHGARTRVTIDHELRSPLAPIIGKYFIDPVATRTLNCMKSLVEERA